MFGGTQICNTSQVNIARNARLTPNMQTPVYSANYFKLNIQDLELGEITLAEISHAPYLRRTGSTPLTLST